MTPDQVAAAPPAAAARGSAASAEPGTSLAGLLARRWPQTPGRVAYCRRELGIWREATWREYATEVASAVAALRSLGVGAGDRVMVMGDSRPEFVAVLLAAQLLRASCVNVYPAIDAKDLQALVAATTPKVCVGETVDDADLLADALTCAGLRSDQVFTLEESFQQRDRRSAWRQQFAAAADADELAVLAAQLREDDVAVVVCSAGTTGSPRAYAVTHAAMLSVWPDLLARLPGIDASDRVLADQPIAHPAGLATAAVLPLLTGCVPFFVDDPREVAIALAELQPSVRVATARYWTTLSGAVRAEIADANVLQRGLFASLLARSAGPGSSATGKGSMLGRVAVGWPLLRRLGLRRARVCLAVGGSVSAEVAAFWRAFGLPLTVVYSLAEAGGPAGLQAKAADGGASEFAPLGGLDVASSASGELTIRGPAITGSQLAAGVAVSAVDSSGWLRTGDLGARADGGGFSLRGRLAPSGPTGAASTNRRREIEDTLTGTVYIARAIVLPDGDGMRALVRPRSAAVEGELRRRGVVGVVGLEGEGDAAADVREFLRATVLPMANERLAAAGLPQLDGIDLFDVELTPPDVTPTGEVTEAFRVQLALESTGRAGRAQ